MKTIMGTAYHKKSGGKYIIIAEGIDTSSKKDRTAVTIYTKARDRRQIYVKEKVEFDEEFNISSSLIPNFLKNEE